MRDIVRIPTALQLCLDDVAWHNGYDERHIGKPSRSGIPRKHAPEDYRIVNEVGRAIGMKILCPLCLGEWDKENLLRGEIGITYDPQNWNRASLIDYDLAEQYLQAAEDSEYLEYAVHGLLHGNYDENGKQLNEQEYFVRKSINGKYITMPVPMEDLKRRLDLFQKIYDSWGFQKKIRSFVSPGGVGTFSLEELEGFAEELYHRGLLYWTNGWFQLEHEYKILNGVCCLRESGSSAEHAPWNAYDFDPVTLRDFCSEDFQQKKSVFGLHWTNFLRYNPARNMEYLDDWVRYFKRQSEIFGLMISRDIAFCANQQLYCSDAMISLEKDEEKGTEKCRIDLTKVAEQHFALWKKEFYISFRNQVRPKQCIGGKIELYETHRNFRTYKVAHDAERVEILM